MHNSFDEIDRKTFDDIWECFYCGMNTNDCLHHIVGRGNGDSTCESSILNAAPFCNQKCHLPNHGLICTDEYRKKLLSKTYSFLLKRGYIFKEIDIEFLMKYAKFYAT